MATCAYVDSDAEVRDLATRFLGSDGHTVLAFGDGSALLDRLKAAPKAADVIVLSWTMTGGMSGAQLLARLLQEKIAAPRIVVSEIVSLEVRNRATALGAGDLLRKPLDGDRLRRAVRKAVGDPREADPLVAELRAVLIGGSDAFVDAVVKLAKAIRAVRQEKTAVLLVAGNGCGKELFAQELHRRVHPEGSEIEAVNLAGLSEQLIESELFGHEKGAFTGAHSQHLGAFERAGTRTLFLDEIGYLDLRLQPKLLRAVQQREFLRVGGQDVVRFEAHLVCATNRNLAEEVKRGAFREDLYHRVSEFEIRIPALQERKEDIVPLVHHFLKGTGYSLEPETWDILKSYSFPGNVRELQNILKQARALCDDKRIRPVDLPGEIMENRVAVAAGEAAYRWPADLMDRPYDKAAEQVLREFDRTYLRQKLDEAGGNKSRAARNIGLTPKTLRKKLRDCELGDLAGEDEEDAE